MKIKFLILVGLFSLQATLAQETVIDSVKVKQEKLILEQQKAEKERIKAEEKIIKEQQKAEAFNKRGYKLISGGTDNHMMLIDLRNKGISGKDAENALVKAEITVNKNMVPFDDKSPFVTSGIRVGTPAITTRGLVEEDMETVVALIDKVLMNHTDEAVLEQVAEEVNDLMSERAMFVF